MLEGQRVLGTIGSPEIRVPASSRADVEHATTNSGDDLARVGKFQSSHLTTTHGFWHQNDDDIVPETTDLLVFGHFIVLKETESSSTLILDPGNLKKPREIKRQHPSIILLAAKFHFGSAGKPIIPFDLGVDAVLTYVDQFAGK